ncbi:uncharacterized protein FFUJ_10513 [Fusarium fujikuroi IMI 58289]|uniref:Uncharacterized protein n=1 Tax=Gibberella fujikuroi (strain CBS 195.34 / IMI 58289 / NRRL A-6831) TaxID=1279085 RepID=S0EIJ7_GIBF5|nr:uncharacterized protein FFUJ_10513 [Fusarium fujikuroi IMI 58289]KLO94859.1 uncharacterized protein LW93_3547 [Fusarium fujikuroi]KLP05544.1 uncharacterized protein LW94_3372 [Fusarium fujikuroi]CCT74460.1 uncharacterized protein FFUJ_10513 [Fusarium fujikuroi IMI 58289]
MHFATIIATAALAMGVAAEPASKDLPFNVISARIWSSKDCGGDNNNGNLGELTTHRDELNECFKFTDKVKSVSQYEHAKGCKRKNYLTPKDVRLTEMCIVLLFTDSNCKRGQKTVKDDQCRETSSHFSSYKTICN